MQFRISFFLTFLIDFLINDSWPSCMSPVSFYALRVRNFCLILLKTSSIGLYSGA